MRTYRSLPKKYKEKIDSYPTVSEGGRKICFFEEGEWTYMIHLTIWTGERDFVTKAKTKDIKNNTYDTEYGGSEIRWERIDEIDVCQTEPVC